MIKLTTVTVKWFEDIKRKDKKRILQFDIASFYPSITEELLMKALNLAKQNTYVADSTVNVIMISSKSILFLNQETWTKTAKSNFYTTMWSYCRAERSELVGICMFWLLAINPSTGVTDKENIGLYRDDGVAVTEGESRESDNLRKKVEKNVKEEKLTI